MLPYIIAIYNEKWITIIISYFSIATGILRKNKIINV